MTETTSAAPQIEQAQLDLLEKLCNASGVSGDEGEVRAIVLEKARPLADEVRVDALGTVLVTRRGSGENNLRVMLAAHMDEVGFMLVNDDEGGLFRFDTVGSLDVRQLVGKPVIVGRDHLPGVIGARPIHLTTAEERKRAVPLDALRIDIGLEGGKVRPGDRAVFATRFSQVGPSLRAKALDDRLGVAILLELLRQPPANVDLLLAFTVQEEIGARGARVAAYTFKPDLALAVDCTPANDLPDWDGGENTSYNTRLGAGPAVYVMDSGTISDPRLVKHLAAAAEAEQIPFQFRQPGGGGTDAGAIHLQVGGIPSVSLSVPGRYLHTAVSLARTEDWQNCLALLKAALRRLDRSLFTQG